MLTFHIKFVSLKNIDIYPIYGPKSIIFGAYAQIWAYSILLITQSIYTCVQDTSSYKYSTPKHGFEHV